MIDVVVVGSGASGVHAAWPLVKAGLRVTMLDVGHTSERYEGTIPSGHFTGLRRSDHGQHRYFLGEEFEGLPFGDVRVGAQLTPPRSHIARAVAQAATNSDGFQAMQSFALGGLAAGWGAAVPPFSDVDLAGWPISRQQLQPHYDAVARRIGICGVSGDDLERWLGPSPYLLPPARQDSNGSWLLDTYQRRAGWFHGRGLYAGQPRLALATRRHAGRGPCQYLDMEFWGDTDRSVYRPVYTLDQLRTRPNFTYLPGHYVEGFTEGEGVVRIRALNLDTGTRESLEAGSLVLACGAIQSARVAAGSLGAVETPMPLLSNPYTYFPCLLWTRLGQVTRDRRHSLTQVMMYFDPHRRPQQALQAQVYSYRSLLTFKLLKEGRLPIADSLRILQHLQSYFVIVGVHHPDYPSSNKNVRVRREDGGVEISYQPTMSERRRRTKMENELLLVMYRLGCWPLGRMDPGYGSSIHYAGTLPMTEEDRPMTTTPQGRLRGTRRVYIADGAAFPTLPCKGLTYTLMANGDRVGRQIARTS
jgi:choline dehydrogenase-like flavoprotein